MESDLNLRLVRTDTALIQLLNQLAASYPDKYETCVAVSEQIADRSKYMRFTGPIGGGQICMLAISCFSTLIKY